MPELRRDPVSGAHAIVAPNRAARPHVGVPAGRHAGETARMRPRFDPHCPFCPGNEAMLPAILAEVPACGGAPWWARAVPNRYPAVTAAPEGETHPAAPLRAEAALGAHEVLIEAPEHDLRLGDLAPERLAAILRFHHTRYRHLLALPGTAAVVLFRNEGGGAGASLVHSHAQAVALSATPPAVAARERRQARYQAETGRCLVCDALAAEIGDGRRIVFESAAFVGFVPFAPCIAGEVRIVPRRCTPDFSALAEDDLTALAQVLRPCLRAIADAYGAPPFNLVLRSASVAHRDAPFLHWHIDLFVRIDELAGFEIGAGIAILPATPEEQAARLRRALEREGARG